MSIYFKLIFASFLWGTNVIVMKQLLGEVPFLLLAAMRVFFSFLFLGLYMIYKKTSFQCLQKRKILLLGFIGIYLNFYFTFLGMNDVKGVDNALMNAIAPMLSFLFSLCLLQKKAKWYEYIALFISLFAFLLSIHFQIFSIQKGFLYLLIGLSLYIVSQVFIQKWNLHHTLSLTFYQLGFGLIFLILHCIYKQQFHISYFVHIPFIYWILFLVISGAGFAFIQVIYMQSVEKIGVLKTSSFLSMNPFITYIEALIFLNEQFDIIHFISFILIFISIYFMNFYKYQIFKKK
jgi:EamA-like transporter family.